jgi:hypothetical protein
LSKTTIVAWSSLVPLPWGNASKPGPPFAQKTFCSATAWCAYFGIPHESKMSPSPSVLHPSPVDALMFRYEKAPATKTWVPALVSGPFVGMIEIPLPQIPPPPWLGAAL